MKSFLAFGLLLFAISFCIADDRAPAQKEESAEKQGAKAEGSIQKAKLSPEHVRILDGGHETKWDHQGVSWTFPGSGWEKMDVKKEMFMYGSVDAGFLIVTISTMPENFPSETSLEQSYQQALKDVKNEKYERAQWLEIDGIKGFEWVEVMPEDTGDARRHQWVACRNYKGKNQQLSIMVSTKGGSFEARREIFAAILYSTKFDK